MDTRAARRAVEKTARDCLATQAALAGELGVAQAERTHQDVDVDHGRHLVADADADADVDGKPHSCSRPPRLAWPTPSSATQTSTPQRQQPGGQPPT